jgi:hypothetical protein
MNVAGSMKSRDAVRLVCFASFLALAGCAGRATGPQAFCDAQAESAPAVKALTVDSVSNPYFMSRNAELIAATKAPGRAAGRRRG